MIKAATLVRWYNNLSPLGKAFVDRHPDVTDYAIDYAIETEDSEGEEFWSEEGRTDDDFDDDFLIFLENCEVDGTDISYPMCIWFELEGESRVSEPFANLAIAAAVWKRWFNGDPRPVDLFGFVNPNRALTMQEMGDAEQYPNAEDVAGEGE